MKTVIQRATIGLAAVATILLTASTGAFADSTTPPVTITTYIPTGAPSSSDGVTPDEAVNAHAPCFQIESSGTWVHVYIGDNGVCTDDESSTGFMGRAYVTRTATGKWTINVLDWNCDNFGVTWKAHKADGTQFSDGSGGCYAPAKIYYVTRSQLANTSVNWWIFWGGYNSLALTFP